MVKGHYLKLSREPSLEALKAAAGGYDLADLDEVVFCGFGEPTQRLRDLLEMAAWLKGEGVRRIRLDTDGLGSLVHGRDIIPELAAKVDALSVSMNAPDAGTYEKMCPNPYGERAYEAMKDFLRSARGRFAEVTATVVGMPDMDVEACRKVAEDELGVAFRVREYNEVG